ncbi:MAG: hypothetical protein JRI23_26415, partial [Deltaproteobacteria bacterium]|nr:hypothetical protein [Deltaproteobacteria bacterium]MBW2535570.1 hypothetical protein [Deltaproteobacteria bacterium]
MAGQARPSSSRPTWLAALALPLACGAATACTVAFDYPPTEAEASAEACANGTDDDFDGTIDCDDPSCDGHCAEQSPEACGDGRDNDGDGFIDQTDPRCWPARSPEVVRCAASDPVRFEESFDAFQLSDTRWFGFGILPDTGAPVIQLQDPVERTERPDWVLGVTPDGPADGVMGGLGSVELFDGDWSRFELSVRVKLDEDGFGRVALVPAALAPAGQQPGTTAEDSAVMIELDGAAEPPVALRLGGQRFALPWGDLDRWHQVRLIGDGDELRLSVDAAYELHLDRPEMGAARLVVWGKAVPKSGIRRAIQFDDLRLDLEGSARCQSQTPQIPLGSSCRLDPDKLIADVGFSVALAGGEGQPLCAVVTTAPAGDVQATGAESWTSSAGHAWSYGGALQLSANAAVVGAGVAWDGAASEYVAVVAERDGDDLALRVSRSQDCASWSAPSSATALPDDAEAPSLLVPGLLAPYEVYFTRPPTDERGRTLWRLRSSDGQSFEADPSQVTELAAELGTAAPVRLARIGPKDVSLLYPISPATGVAGLGLAIAMEETLTRWELVERFPLLPWTPANAGFDGEAIVSAALHYDGGSGFVLYGGRGRPFPFAGVGRTRSPLTTGTAWLGAPGTSPPPSAAPRAALACGDGSCDDGEACESCAVDCGVCEGELVLAERFIAPKHWTMLAPYDPTVGASKYILASPGTLRLQPHGWGWLVEQLPYPIEGDFELSFDVHVVAPNADGSEPRCTAYVGIGRMPETHELSPDGIYAAIDQQLGCTPGAPAFSTRVNAGRHELTSVVPAEAAEAPDSCAGAVVGRAEQWHRVILRRQSGRASVRVLGADGCELSPSGDASVAYVGSVSSLDALLVGFGGTWSRDGWTTGCEEGTALVQIDNAVLRLLPCPHGGTSCETTDGERSVCVDLEASPEHCGGCNQPVGEAEVCNGGSVWCAGAMCSDGAGGEVCADLQTDRDHCGSCGSAVG